LTARIPGFWFFKSVRISLLVLSFFSPNLSYLVLSLARGFLLELVVGLVLFSLAIR